MNMMRKLLFLVALPLALFFNCANNLSPLASDLGEKGGFLFKVNGIPSDEVVSGVVTVSKGGLSEVENFTLVNGTASVPFDDLQVGRWQILVRLLDSEGFEIYTGEGSGVVSKNGTTHVAISAKQNTGTLVIDIGLEAEIPDGLVFWNKLGSTEEIAQSLIGPALQPIGTSYSFESGVYGNGFKHSTWFVDDMHRNNQALRTTTVMDSMAVDNYRKITVEFWYKPDYDVIDGVAQDGGHHGTVTLFDNQDLRNDYNGNLYYNKSIGLVVSPRPGEGTYIQWWVSATVAGWVGFKGFNLNAGQWYHIAMVVDLYQPTVAERYKLIVDGNPLSPVVFPAGWNPHMEIPVSTGVESQNMKIGVGDYAYLVDTEGMSVDFSSKGVLDNLKIWNYAKTDFSDRFTE